MKTFSLVMALLLFAMPFFTLAQPIPTGGDAGQAIIDAKRDAEAKSVHSDGTAIWGLSACFISSRFGCLGGSSILFASRIYKPPVPRSERLIGKSIEYITFYTQTYQETKQRRYTQAALGGCIGGSMAAAFVYRYYSPKHSFSLIRGIR